MARVEGLRPTPDRVRETLFNWLGQELRGWRCLDAFAGTGALGFEAASRGAAEVVLLERDALAARALQETRSRLAAWRSCTARTKVPGRSRTALRRVLKSPPVSGARKRRACWASWGTLMKMPSVRASRVQVSTRVNQSLGGWLVAPRRKPMTRTKWLDWFSGRSG